MLKVWSDFKNNTKKKAERLRRKANGTDVRPAIYAKLSGLEERVLNVMGMQAATGSELDGAGSFQVISVSRLAHLKYIVNFYLICLSFRNFRILSFHSPGLQHNLEVQVDKNAIQLTFY